jgi:hypothetical protein
MHVLSFWNSHYIIGHLLCELEVPNCTAVWMSYVVRFAGANVLKEPDAYFFNHFSTLKVEATLLP